MQHYLGQTKYTQEQVEAERDNLLHLDNTDLQSLARSSMIAPAKRIAAIVLLDEHLTAAITPDSDFKREVSIFDNIRGFARMQDNDEVRTAAGWVMVDWVDRRTERENYLDPRNEFSGHAAYGWS